MSTLEYTLTAFGQDGTRHQLLWRPHVPEMVWKKNQKPVDLTHLGFTYETKKYNDFVAVSPQEPGRKSRELKKVKISLGMKCNYSCAYCNQAAQPHDSQGTPEDVKHFLEHIGDWFDGGPEGDGTGIQFELWGGEPLVYWKNLQLLVPGLKALYPKGSINMITNASLLTPEIINWIEKYDISVGISHDGPVYGMQRGEDPLKDPEQLAMIKLLYERRSPYGAISFQVVLTNLNPSLAKARAYIAKHLKVPEYELMIGTEEILQPYDAGGLMLSPVTPADHKYLLDTTFFEAVKEETSMVSTIEQKVTDFFRSLAFRKPWTANGQKCGMDDPRNISVTLKGQVTTCQNTSPDTKHLLGHVDDFDNIKLDTAWHFTKRDECKTCPVVSLCGGACMFNEGKFWTQGCDNAFTYNVAMLAYAVYKITKGLVLEKIDGNVIRRAELGPVANVIDWDTAMSHVAVVEPK